MADEWIANGMPELPGKTGRPLSETLDINTVIWTIRQSALTPADAERIVRTLKDRKLIETTVVKAGPARDDGTTRLPSTVLGLRRQPVHSGQTRSRARGLEATALLRYGQGWIRGHVGSPSSVRCKRLGDLPKGRSEGLLPLARGGRTQAERQSRINTALSTGASPLVGRMRRKRSLANPRRVWGEVRGTADEARRAQRRANDGS